MCKYIGVKYFSDSYFLGSHVHIYLYILADIFIAPSACEKCQLHPLCSITITPNTPHLTTGRHIFVGHLSES